MLRFLWLLPIVLSCADATDMPHGARGLIAETYDNQIRFLAQSLYAGPFFDDDRYRLLSSAPFSEVEALRSLDGETLSPGVADDILPAGTKIQVVSVKFADGQELLRRGLFTPRFSTWVELRLLGGSGYVDERRARHHIVLFPSYLKDKADFAAFYDRLFQKDDPRPWLRGLGRAIERGIKEKHAVVGMDRAALFAALGDPTKVSRVQKDGQEVLALQFGNNASVFLRDGVVQRVVEADATERTIPR